MQGLHRFPCHSSHMLLSADVLATRSDSQGVSLQGWAGSKESAQTKGNSSHSPTEVGTNPVTFPRLPTPPSSPRFRDHSTSGVPSVQQPCSAPKAEPASAQQAPQRRDFDHARGAVREVGSTQGVQQVAEAPGRSLADILADVPPEVDWPGELTGSHRLTHVWSM